jgi:RNA polymerase sigma factor (sigma-70 family)
VSKDYALKVAVKNNKLLSLMRSVGVKTMAQLSKETGVNQSALGDIANLRKAAYLVNGEQSSATIALCNYFKVLPEDIYPAEQLRGALKKNTHEKEIDFNQMMSLSELGGDNDVLAIPNQKFNQEDYDKIDSSLLDNLNVRERYIITGRFGLDGSEEKTYVELGRELGICNSRVSQIEARALRRLRASNSREEMKQLFNKI